MKNDRLHLEEQFQAHAERLSECVLRWRFGTGSGKSAIDVCELWDGIYIWANRIMDYDLPGNTSMPQHVAALNICLYGRCEVKLPDGRYVYMERGTGCLCGTIPQHGYHYPGGSYEGVELFFDLNVLENGCPAALTDYGLGFSWLREKLKDNADSWMVDLREDCLQLAEELSRMLEKEDVRLTELRFRALELLHRIENGGTGAEKERAYVTQGQRRIANEVERKLTEDLGRRMTVAELAAPFCVSESALKKYFTLVYGVPLTDYLRERRMELARTLLAETRLSIGEIAARCGYGNPSKFGEVFLRETKTTPTEYRRLHFHANDGQT